MNVDPDLPLVERCQSGDISAFDDLVRAHRDRVYRLVYRILGGGDGVEDVAQEVFLRAYSKIGKFRCESPFSTWLTRIAVNCSISHLKSQRSIRFFHIDMFSRDEGYPSSAEIPVERSEKCEKLYCAIDSLSPKQRAVIILHYFEEYSCEEIAGIFNCSVGTVKSRLFHARRKLKELLEPYLRSGEWLD